MSDLNMIDLEGRRRKLLAQKARLDKKFRALDAQTDKARNNYLMAFGVALEACAKSPLHQSAVLEIMAACKTLVNTSIAARLDAGLAALGLDGFNFPGAENDTPPDTLPQDDLLQGADESPAPAHTSDTSDTDTLCDSSSETSELFDE